MSTHITDELPRLLTGEADRETVLSAAAHLRTCPDCQQELVSAVVAHASLMSARRFAPEVALPFGDQNGNREPGTDAGPSGDTGASVSGTGLPPVARPAHPLPDLSSVFDKVRDEAARGGSRSAPRRTRVLIGVAAAAVVAAGGITAGVLATSSGGPAETTVALVGPDRTVATATLIGGDHMRINASALPALDARHQYEVWLTDTSGKRKVSVGWIGADRTADIKVPAPVMGAYADIAVSVQGIHQTRFSGDVVARGNYA